MLTRPASPSAVSTSTWANFSRRPRSLSSWLGVRAYFMSLNSAASQFGASDAQLSTIAQSVSGLGLQFTADPTRLFGRVTGSAKQWQTALGAALSMKPATASSPFATYTMPAHTPGALQPTGTSLLLSQAQVYDPAAEGHRSTPPTTQVAAGTAPTTTTSEPWPLNNGTPLTAGCSSPLLKHRYVYTEQQVQTAYGINQLRSKAAGTPVITILDLGGGWLQSDLNQAGQCFGYTRPRSARPRATVCLPRSSTPTTRRPWTCRRCRRWPPGRSCGLCKPRRRT
jgi:hypothetical protein